MRFTSMRATSLRAAWSVAATVTAITVAVPAFANPAGDYMVTGTNPGNQGSYQGSVSVTKAGDGVWNVKWVIDGQTFVGTGIGDKDFISVGYKSGDTFGIVLYVRDGQLWQGVWTYGGGTEMGQETWTPK